MLALASRGTSVKAALTPELLDSTFIGIFPSFCVRKVLSIGDNLTATRSRAALLLENFDAEWEQAKNGWSDYWYDAFVPKTSPTPTSKPPPPSFARPSTSSSVLVPRFEGNLPTLVTADAELHRVYYVGVVSMLVLAKHVTAPQAWFAGELVFVNTLIDCGETELYVWDTCLNSVLLTLLQPSMFHQYMDKWLTMSGACFDDPTKTCTGIHSHNDFDYLQKESNGPWYAFNDLMVFRGMATLASYRGPVQFASAPLAGRTGIDWMRETATFGSINLTQKGASNDAVPLADYGAAYNLLECVPTYLHKVPSLNAANAWMMRSTAAVLRALGNATSTDDINEIATLEAAATNVSKAVRDRLYVAPSAPSGGGGYWACEMPNGTLIEVRHVIDFSESSCVFIRCTGCYHT